jgi:hypothetical protein
MNRVKWADPDVSLEMLAAKLAEETGEAIAEVISAVENSRSGRSGSRDAAAHRASRAIMELDHVNFISSVLVYRLRKVIE